MVTFQKSHFLRLNCQIKFVSFCVQSQPGLEIRIRDDFQTFFDIMNQLKVLNFPNELRLKSSFFEVNPCYTIFHEILVYLPSDSVLEIEHIPRLVLMSGIQF